MTILNKEICMALPANYIVRWHVVGFIRKGEQPYYVSGFKLVFVKCSLRHARNCLLASTDLCVST